VLPLAWAAAAKCVSAKYGYASASWRSLANASGGNAPDWACR
jgi:hypothetical protein